ncbi:conserved hypothetical protein [Ricinus communis]|uniref:Uncharacterized protein n=1 Tax=Ricinus communis TaxID=3988 RepID=B9T455_RICCO|nr:conserved hypothetical protein [Ricinus communis]
MVLEFNGNRGMKLAFGAEVDGVSRGEDDLRRTYNKSFEEMAKGSKGEIGRGSQQKGRQREKPLVLTEENN